MAKNTPPAPDYMGLANQMGAIGNQLTTQQTYANRPNVTTPYGNVTWTPPQYDPNIGTQAGLGGTGATGTGTGGSGGGYPGSFGAGFVAQAAQRAAGTMQPSGGTGYGGAQEPGQWGLDISLSPDQQAALDSQQRIGAARSGLAEDMFSRVSGELGQAPDWGSVPGMPDTQQARQLGFDSAYGQAASRLDPMWEQKSEAFQSQLMNQGLRPGTKAYDTAMANLGRDRNDAYQSAINNANLQGEQFAAGEFSRGLTGRQQGISELLQRRGTSLNEVNALLSGAQVSMPGMPSYSSTAGVSQTPNLMGAGQAGYSAGMDQFNAQQAQMQNLMSLAGGAGGLPFMF